ncbi:hypothetical protein [Lentzea terrae]|uniref:hypothetical protein n=1 Tax=Lentzea terrae TaxID=2200761 RepID=UPI000DD2F56D|nr:hypothetical protein [Lentzea terrae]
MDHVLANALHERVFAILNQLESPHTPETTRLTAAWRALLNLHEQTDSGSCKACGPRWRKHMCSVWRTAANHFVRHERRYSGA